MPDHRNTQTMPVEVKWYKNGSLLTLGEARQFISDYYVSLAPTIAESIKRRHRKEEGDWPSWLVVEVKTFYYKNIKDVIAKLRKADYPIDYSITNDELLRIYTHLNQNGYEIKYWRVWK